MKDSCPKHTRLLVAQQAARMMADEGFTSYAHAKRKAARQLGLPDDRCLPSNTEVDEAIRAHHEIFHGETHELQLQQLRREAISIMRLLEQFDPHLSGAVLDGTAGRYAQTEIHLFADSLKDVELFLLNQQIPYRMEEKPYRFGNEKHQLPAFMLESKSGPVQLIVFARDDLRMLPKKSRNSGKLERASLSALMAMTQTT